MADLFSATEFKDHYGIATTTWDTWLAVLATQVTARVARYCNRITFDSASYTDDVDGTGTDSITLANIPVSSITSVSVDQGRDFSTTMSASDYVIELETGILTLLPERFTTELFSIAGEWPLGVKNVRVVYVAGYSTIPVDLKLTAIEWCGVIFNRRRSQGFVSQTIGGATVMFETGSLPKSIREQLGPFRRQPSYGGYL